MPPCKFDALAFASTIAGSHEIPSTGRLSSSCQEAIPLVFEQPHSCTRYLLMQPVLMSLNPPRYGRGSMVERSIDTVTIVGSSVGPRSTVTCNLSFGDEGFGDEGFDISNTRNLLLHSRLISPQSAIAYILELNPES